MPFVTPTLMSHQQYAKSFIKKTKKCGLFLDVGCGKTLTILSAFYELNLPYHILVIAPKNIAKTTWFDEIEKWGFPVRAQSLIVNDKGKNLSRKKRLDLYHETLTSPPTIYFINKELVPDLCKNLPKKDNREIWPFGIVVIDEVQGFKSHSSERFKALKKHTASMAYFVGATGTPTPQGLMDLWAEVYLMDQGKRLGRTITEYRNKFFTPYKYNNGYPIAWRPNPGAEEEIYRLISDIVISVKNTVLDLPEVTFNPIKVYMDENEQKMYKEFMKTQVLKIEGETIKAVNAAVLQNKLSQMASGALYINDEKEYAIIHTKKIEYCNYIINNTDSPILIAYHFQSDRELLLKHIPQAQLFDGSRKMVHDWNKKKIPVMLLQPQSAGHGLNLQDGGHTLIWYTLSWSLEAYLQTNARLYRKGQKNNVIIHILMTDKTVDSRILSALDRKDLSEKALLDAVEMTIKDIA